MDYEWIRGGYFQYPFFGEGGMGVYKNIKEKLGEQVERKERKREEEKKEKREKKL